MGLLCWVMEFFRYRNCSWTHRNEPNRIEIKMNITISGHHIEVTPALKSYVTSKLDKVLTHFDEVVDAKVTLSVEPLKEKDGQRAECNLHLKGTDIFAESSNADLYAPLTTWPPSWTARSFATRKKSRVTPRKPASALLPNKLGEVGQAGTHRLRFRQPRSGSGGLLAGTRARFPARRTLSKRTDRSSILLWKKLRWSLRDET